MRDSDVPMLRSMCQFFALTSDEKLAFLPPIGETHYMYNECGDRTFNPLFYYCNAAFELMDRACGGGSGLQAGFDGIVADIRAMLSMMVLKAYPSHIWHLDKTQCYVMTGEEDRYWSILQRLAIQALSEKSWSRTFPEIPFDETGWSGVRKADAPALSGKIIPPDPPS